MKASVKLLLSLLFIFTLLTASVASAALSARAAEDNGTSISFLKRSPRGDDPYGYPHGYPPDGNSGDGKIGNDSEVDEDTDDEDTDDEDTDDEDTDDKDTDDKDTDDKDADTFDNGKSLLESDSGLLNGVDHFFGKNSDDEKANSSTVQENDPERNSDKKDSDDSESFLSKNKTAVIIVAAVLCAALAAVAVFVVIRSKSHGAGSGQNKDPGQPGVPGNKVGKVGSHNNDRTYQDTAPTAFPAYAPPAAVRAPINGAVSGTRVRATSVSNVGRRKNQEDSFGISDINNETLCRGKGVMAVVADGMGGLESGEEVSSAAVQNMLQGFSDGSAASTGSQELTRLLNITVRNVNDLLERTIGLRRAGSTLMAVIIHEMELSWVSVGDSRTALFRNGKLTDLNRRHNYAAELQEMVNQGRITADQAKTHPDRDKLTSYVGMGNLKYVDQSVRPFPLLAGDRIILMSDGVFNALSDAEIEQILSLPFDRISSTLEAAVLQKNSPHQDNFTAVILEIPAG